ncbi:hypothetical protein U1Q18_020504 [Sarracenia purpurea var. burkii]
MLVTNEQFGELALPIISTVEELKSGSLNLDDKEVEPIGVEMPDLALERDVYYVAVFVLKFASFKDVLIFKRCLSRRVLKKLLGCLGPKCEEPTMALSEQVLTICWELCRDLSSENRAVEKPKLGAFPNP